MIRTHRNGITFEYITSYQWITIRDHVNRVVKIPGYVQKAGVRITYPCGCKRFISNDWYSKQDIENL